ncbi:COG4223 family protein [Azospirillum sp. ST 5-10]|uniref:COG4223 family protein n=1 Tax=unclassified Azospirillum TaxID=2630922 RepID=UPI003F4A78CC
MTDPNRDDSKAGSATQADESAKGFPQFIIAPPGAERIGAPFEPAGPYAVAPEPPPPPPPAAPPRRDARREAPPRARGGRLAVLAALVALAAAGAAIAAPSLRPLLAESLRQQFGDHRLIAVLTGTADTRPPGVVELDLQAFDQRLETLAAALRDTPAGQPVDAATLERFVAATSDGRRVADLEAALRRAETQVTTLSDALGTLEGRLAEIGTRTERLEATDGTLTGRIEAAEGAAGALEPRVAAVEQAGVATAAKADAAAAQAGTLAGLLDTLGATAADLGGRLAAVEARMAELATAIQGNADAAAAAAEAARTNAAAIQSAATETATTTQGLTERLAATESAAGALTDRLAAAEGAAGTLAGRVDAADAERAAAAERLAQLGQALDGTRGELAETGKAVAAATTELAALTARTGAVEDHLARVNGGTASALLALSSRIRQALEDGESFTGEVAAVRALAGGNSELTGAIDTLQQLASRGGPTLTLLRREFNLAAQKIIEAEEAAGPAWYVRTVSTMGAQVTSWFGWVQPPMPSPGEEARAIVTEAAKSFTLGRIDDAVAVLKTISGPGAAAAEPWIRLAQVRVDAERALRALSDAALERLSHAP